MRTWLAPVSSSDICGVALVTADGDVAAGGSLAGKLSASALSSPAWSSSPTRVSACMAASVAAPVAAVALARLRVVLRRLAHVGAERAADVVGLAEAAVFVATDEALVALGFDQFAFAWHDKPR